MRASTLRLNPSKTRFLWLDSPQQLRQVDVIDIAVVSTKIKVVGSARNLELPATASCHYLHMSLLSVDPDISNVDNCIQLFVHWQPKLPKH